jgi:hypothetical protein
MFQSLIVLNVLFRLLQAKYLPSGENAKQVIIKLWLCSVVTSFCDCTLQIFTLFPSLPKAKYLPSGENAMDFMD